VDSAWWPSTVPEIFLHAAGRVVSGQDMTIVADRLRTGLGLTRPVHLAGQAFEDARNAATLDAALFDELTLAVIACVGAQLPNQYPASSLLWDAAGAELHEVLAAFDFTVAGPGTWNRSVSGGRTVVVELHDRPTACDDDRRFGVRWGIVLPALPFCRHSGPHHLGCCAVAGGLGSVRPPHGDRVFQVTVGMLLERRGDRPVRVVGRQAFRATLHRLGLFCEQLSELDRLAELVAGEPWRAGIGVAEQLRNADPGQLRRLLT
jgi:hypothetical protein